MTGFNGAHWPLWPLLQAAVVSAKEATVLLDDPRDVARDIDETLGRHLGRSIWRSEADIAADESNYRQPVQ